MSKRHTALLVRISDDREGEGLGVERQEKDCRALATHLVWSVDKVYRENDTSAFKRRRIELPDGTAGLRVMRPEFRQLLAALSTGAHDALIAYDLDRVARDPRDLEDLIDVVEHHGIAVRSVTGSLDLSNDAGITMARVMVAVANKSSRDTSRRVRAKYVQLAEQGLPGNGGYRPFGYTADRLHVVDEEAEHLRWAYAQVLAGKALRSILRGFTEREVLTTQGKPWSMQGLRYNLLAPRNAGLREHRKVVVGDAVWPAIVDRETWEKARAILAPRTQPVNSSARRYLLTGFLFCARCGGKLLPRATDANGRRRYGCLPKQEGGCGGITIHCDSTHDLIRDLVLARLERDADLTPDRAPDLTEELLARIATDEQRLDSLAEAFADDPDANPLELRLAGAKIRTRIRDTRAELAKQSLALTVPEPLLVRAAWPGYDLQQQRAVVASLIERIDVGPGTGGRFNPDRLMVVWR
jgi:site-specific DNA recombinase